jgi:hypothetical protein
MYFGLRVWMDSSCAVFYTFIDIPYLLKVNEWKWRLNWLLRGHHEPKTIGVVVPACQVMGLQLQPRASRHVEPRVRRELVTRRRVRPDEQQPSVEIFTPITASLIRKWATSYNNSILTARSVDSSDQIRSKNEQNRIGKSNVFLQLSFSSFFFKKRLDDNLASSVEKSSKSTSGPKLEALTVSYYELYNHRRIDVKVKL